MARKRQRSRGQGTLFKRDGRGPWIASWYDHTGRRRERSTRTTDKAAAERILAKHVAGVALRRDGVVDPRLDAMSDHAKRPIESHISDYETKLRTGNRTPQYIRTAVGYIRIIADACDWSTVSDITADAVNRYAGTLKGANRSARTIQAYLTAIKSLTRWLTNNGKLRFDPLLSVNKPHPESDRRRERRMLLQDEWTWLRSVTMQAPERFGISGTERVLLYAVGIQTGLRSAELRSLSRGRLFLDNDPPFITCKAGTTKNRKDARQYIQRDLADDLRAHVAAKAPKAPVFAMPGAGDVADMLRADLADARREWLDAAKHDPEEYEKRSQSDFLAAVNHDGEHLDFHALRHTCGAWVAMTGAHAKVVQAIMRHSTITLTMDTYGHLFPGQEADAVARLPDMMGDDPEAEISHPEVDYAQLYPPQLGRETAPKGASRCDEPASGAERGNDHNLLQCADLRDGVRCGATSSDDASCGNRTPNPLIENQFVRFPLAHVLALVAKDNEIEESIVSVVDPDGLESDLYALRKGCLDRCGSIGHDQRARRELTQQARVLPATSTSMTTKEMLHQPVRQTVDDLGTLDQAS